MHWVKDTSEGLLYYCMPSVSKRFNSAKIAAFDLDHTIIKPESGKTFPISVDDWIFAYKMDKLRDYSKKGYKIVIFTNQKGSFDGKGNYSLGIKEQIVFPEINYDKVDKVRGFDVTVCTTAQNDTEALALLKAMNFPFTR
jgi:hypothetical protein